MKNMSIHMHVQHIYVRYESAYLFLAGGVEFVEHNYLI